MIFDPTRYSPRCSEEEKKGAGEFRPQYQGFIFSLCQVGWWPVGRQVGKEGRQSSVSQCGDQRLKGGIITDEE